MVPPPAGLSESGSVCTVEIGFSAWDLTSFSFFFEVIGTGAYDPITSQYFCMFITRNPNILFITRNPNTLTGMTILGSVLGAVDEEASTNDVMTSMAEGIDEISDKLDGMDEKMDTISEKIDAGFRDVSRALNRLTAMTQYNTLVIETIYHELWVDPVSFHLLFMCGSSLYLYCVGFLASVPENSCCIQCSAVLHAQIQ